MILTHLVPTFSHCRMCNKAYDHERLFSVHSPMKAKLAIIMCASCKEYY